MEKVVPFFKSFTTIFYFKFFNFGKVLFGPAKDSKDLNRSKPSSPVTVSMGPTYRCLIFLPCLRRPHDAVQRRPLPSVSCHCRSPTIVAPLLPCLCVAALGPGHHPRPLPPHCATIKVQALDLGPFPCSRRAQAHPPPPLGLLSALADQSATAATGVHVVFVLPL
jgi:hypothetical protein